MKNSFTDRVTKLQEGAIEADNSPLELIEDLYEAVTNRDKLISGMKVKGGTTITAHFNCKVKIACSILQHKSMSPLEVIRDTNIILRGLMDE